MDKVYFSINEVSEVLDLKPHTIRYWETELASIMNKRKRYTNRYTANEVELFRRLKDLIVDRKFTLKGAVIEIKNSKAQDGKVADIKTPKNINIKQRLIEIKNILIKEG
jgi:DNA-binding transcriptional MerR regulator